MPDALDFNQLGFRDDFINNPVVAQPDAISVFRAAQFFHAVRKGIVRQAFNRLDDSLRSAGRQFEQIFARGFLPLNAKGHCVSALS